MASHKPAYYLDRAAEEREAAAVAPTSALAKVHQELAAMYERKAREEERKLAFELTE